MGIDAGGLDDPTSVTVLAEAADDRFVAWNQQWLTTQGVQRRAASTDYEPFIQAGELVVVEEVSEDLDQARKLILRVREQSNLTGVGLDPHGLVGLSSELESARLSVQDVAQVWRLSPYLDRAERMLYSGQLRHAASGLMRWHIENCRVQTKSGNRTIHKAEEAQHGGGASKIDGVVSLLAAVAIAVESPRKRSVHETRGVRFV